MIYPVGSYGAVNTVLPPLAVGDVVAVKVTGVNQGKFTILVNGTTLEAESSLPLSVGERITVRIASLEPRIVLVPLESKRDTSNIALEKYLRLFHQEPRVVADLLRLGKELLTANQRESYRGTVSDALLTALTEKFDALFDHGMDVGKWAAALGLFHERDIARGTANPDNLKALLLKLAEKLEQLPSPKPIEVGELARWVKMAVERIDVCQLVNVLSRDREGLCYVPIPFLFGEEVRVGDFFCRAKPTPKGKECKVWIFVDFPELGSIMMDLSLVGKRLSAFIRCGQAETRDVLAEKLVLMKEKLNAAGYEISTLGCSVERELDNRRQALWEEVPAYAEGALQVRV